MEFVHPKITVFDHDQNDYEDGREGSGIRMSFDYEGVIYDLEPQLVTSGSLATDPEAGNLASSIDKFGFSSTYYDIGSIILSSDL